MIRINLLPKEIQERRRYEGYFIWVYVAAAVIVFFIIGTWLILGFGVQAKNRDLQSRQELAGQLRAEADAYSVFESKQAALSARQAVVANALADRINWAKVSNELSLVLPSDVWATAVSADQTTGLDLTLLARDVGDSPDVGQKAVARAMVRLNDLDTLQDVWLRSTAKSAPDSANPKAERRVQFQLTAQVAKASNIPTSAPSAQ